MPRGGEAIPDRKGAQNPSKVLCFGGGPPEAGEAPSEAKEGGRRRARKDGSSGRWAKHAEGNRRLAEISNFTAAWRLTHRDPASMLLPPPPNAKLSHPSTVARCDEVTTLIRTFFFYMTRQLTCLFAAYSHE